MYHSTLHCDVSLLVAVVSIIVLTVRRSMPGGELGSYPVEEIIARAKQAFQGTVFMHMCIT